MQRVDARPADTSAEPVQLCTHVQQAGWLPLQSPCITREGRTREVVARRASPAAESSPHRRLAASQGCAHAGAGPRRGAGRCGAGSPAATFGPPSWPGRADAGAGRRDDGSREAKGLAAAAVSGGRRTPFRQPTPSGRAANTRPHAAAGQRAGGQVPTTGCRSPPFDTLPGSMSGTGGDHRVQGQAGRSVQCRRKRISAVRGGRSSSTSASWLARMRAT